jgi:hypothetical protein
MKSFDWAANKALVTDSTGRRMTVGLFKELSDNPAAPFSIEDWHREYVRQSDPTDYAAAMTLIGQWEHWTMLLDCKPFMEHLEKWREEVAVKVRSEAVAELKKQSKTDKGTAAAKWLAEQGVVKTKGRVLKNANDNGVAARVASDAKRLQLVGNK